MRGKLLGDIIARYRPIRTPIAREEQAEVFARIRLGDKRALDRVVRANVLLVAKVIFRYTNQGVSLEDLIAAGVSGIHVAAKRFDPSRGHVFISYAIWWIRQRIMQEIHDTGRLIRIPSNRLYRMHRAKKNPSEADQEEMERFRDLGNVAPLEIADQIDDGPSTDEQADLSMCRAAIMEVINTPGILDQRSRDMVLDRFGFGGVEFNDRDLARKYGTSHETARKRMKLAMRRLKVHRLRVLL